MAMRIAICFPAGEAPALQTEAAQLALGLAAGGHEILALGPLGAWRHPLRLAHVTASELALPGDERKITRAIDEFEPQVLHAFGVDAAHLMLPHTLLVGAGGVVTLGHADVSRLNPTLFRTASTIFVPCEHLREQMARRLPNIPVATTGYLLPPTDAVALMRSRFLAEELGLRDDMPVVLLADHFQGSETEVALMLISATPAIADRVPGVQTVIAGGGARLGELEAAALRINEQLGYRAVLLPGHREDIAQVLALAHVVVGSGRFALEAIGAGVSTVCVGAAGLVGTFTEETAKLTAHTCGGRHGRLDAATPRALASEVVGLFSYPQMRERFALEGQAMVLSQTNRVVRAAQLVTYYQRATPSGVVNQAPQRITVILPGDLRELLLTLPAVSGLRAHFPLAQLQLIVHAPHHGLLNGMPALADRVITRPHTGREWLTLLKALRRPRANACLVYPTDLPSLFLTGLSRAPQRIGFAEGWGTLFLSDHLHARTPVSPARALSLTHALGVSTPAPLAPPTLPEATRETVKISLMGQGVEADDPLILCCPAVAPAWAWPAVHWETLLRRLVGERPEQIAVLDPGELALPDGVATVVPVRDSMMLATLLARASLVIAPDSAVLHLATLLGVPAIGLYGPTTPAMCRLPGAQLAPLCHTEFPCHPCVDDICEERHCLRALTPAEVSAAVARMLYARDETPDETLVVPASDAVI